MGICRVYLTDMRMLTTETYKQLPLQPLLSPAPFMARKVGALLDGLGQRQHRHDFYMLYWTLSGEGSHRVNGRRYDMRPGRVFCIPPGQAHQVLAYPEEGWLVLADTRLLCGLPGGLLVLQQGGAAEPFADLDLDTLGHFNLLAELLAGTSDPAIAAHYIFALWLQAGQQPAHANTSLIARLQTLIGQHFRTEKQAPFYAAKLGLRTRALNRASKLATGRPVAELVSERLLAECETLLAATTLPLKNMAYELGFCDQAHFAAFFRKWKGESPRAFRRGK